MNINYHQTIKTKSNPFIIKLPDPLDFITDKLNITKEDNNKFIIQSLEEKRHNTLISSLLYSLPVLPSRRRKMELELLSLSFLVIPGE